MNLTELEMKLLSILASPESEGGQRVRDLIQATGDRYSGRSIRRALNGFSGHGLTHKSEQAPARWSITDVGKRVAPDVQRQNAHSDRAAR